MNNLPLVSGAAFDIRGLDALKREAKSNSQDGIKSVAKQLEGIFIQMMLKSMRDASFKDNLFNSQQSDMFTSMYDQQISQDIAQQGKMGFSDLMVKQMGGETVGSSNTPGIAPAPYVLNHGISAVRAMLSHFVHSPDIGLNEQTTTLYPRGSGKNTHFISRMLEPALVAAKKSGVPHLLIIAQAALESSWGNKEIPATNGKQSHNLFGIKVTSDWKGESTEVTTTEYIDGALQKVKAAFRVYPSYSEALEDYTSILTKNPRYHNVTHMSTPENVAHALQSGGYATDPDYAKKLINIMNQVKGSISHGMNAYQADLSEIF